MATPTEHFLTHGTIKKYLTEGTYLNNLIMNTNRLLTREIVCQFFAYFCNTNEAYSSKFNKPNIIFKREILEDPANSAYIELYQSQNWEALFLSLISMDHGAILCYFHSGSCVLILKEDTTFYNINVRLRNNANDQKILENIHKTGNLACIVSLIRL